jgi:lantibiotic biosynthesis protein
MEGTATKHTAVYTVLEAIADYLLKKYRSQDGTAKISLHNGDTGILLLQSLLYKTTGDECYNEALEKNLMGIIETIQAPQHQLSPTFCDGLAGVGWLFQYLDEIEVLDLKDSGFYDNLDAYLTVCLDKMLAEKNFDLLHGALGIGVYFLKRKNEKQIEKLVNALYEECEKTNEEIKWSHFEQYYVKEQVYNMGLAHGMAGVIYFLKKCLSLNFSIDKCQTLLQGCLSFYNNNIQDHEHTGAYYPDLIICNQYRNDHSPQKSKLAWCYGDLGILNTLYLNSTTNSVPFNNNTVTSMLMASANRRDDNASLITTPHFCHGYAGAGLIFRNLYMKTGNSFFLETSQFWTGKTIELIDKMYRTAEGYDFSYDRTNTSLDSSRVGLLNGITGVGLLLLLQQMPEAFQIFDSENEWLECFFLY